MQTDMEARYQQRLARYVAAMRKRQPDRVPLQGVELEPLAVGQVVVERRRGVRRDHVEELAAVLARREPGRARQLVETIRAVDEALSRKSALKESVITRNSWVESGLAFSTPPSEPGTEVSLLSTPSSRKLLLRERPPFTETPPIPFSAVDVPGESKMSE